MRRTPKPAITICFRVSKFRNSCQQRMIAATSSGAVAYLGAVFEVNFVTTPPERSSTTRTS